MKADATGLTRHANKYRGEMTASIDGEIRILCLTLGALAELESAFNVNNLSELGSYFSKGKLSASDMIKIMGAALRGGGNLYSDEDVACMNINGGLPALAEIIGKLLTLTFTQKDAPSDQVTKQEHQQDPI